MTLILASSSERRLALLRQVAIEPDAVYAHGVDETLREGELPRARASRLAREKAEAARARRIGENPDSAGDVWILGGDTVVACGRRVLDIPADEAAAAEHLLMLSGRRHRVYGGLCVLSLRGGEWRSASRLVETSVRFRRLTRREVSDYVATGEWRGVAGGYAVQGFAGSFVVWLGGSYSNVVGLGLSETLGLLRGSGWHP